MCNLQLFKTDKTAGRCWSAVNLWRWWPCDGPSSSQIHSSSASQVTPIYYNWKFKKCPIALMMKNTTYKVDLLVCWLYDRGSSYKSLFPVLGADMTIKNHHWSLPSTWVLQGCGWTLGFNLSPTLGDARGDLKRPKKELIVC